MPRVHYLIVTHPILGCLLFRLPATDLAINRRSNWKIAVNRRHSVRHEGEILFFDLLL